MQDPIGEAARRLGAGLLLAFPTETVWGLAADARSDAAVTRLRAWKGRGDDAPLAILVAAAADLEGLGFELTDAIREVVAAFWPGPLTLVMPCRERFAAGIANPSGGVGVRCSAHPLASALARRCAAEGLGPVTATSLNRSGEAAAQTRDEALALCGSDGDEPWLLAVETAEAGGDRETTVLDLCAPAPRVLRWGALQPGDLESVLPELARA